jgi:hypothetical protein
VQVEQNKKDERNITVRAQASRTFSDHGRSDLATKSPHPHLKKQDGSPGPPARNGRRNHVMTYRALGTSLAGVALVVLVAGCAEPGAGFFASRPVATDLAPASDLIGTWHGTLGQVRADQ